MSQPRARVQAADAGFTMFEALVAIALMGLILGALATVTAQWMPNWTRGLVQAQRNEQVAIALDRLVADISAAEYISPNRSENAPLFRGAASAVVFVRSAVGPNGGSGLEIVRIAETTDSRGSALVRMRASFAMLPTGDPLVDPIPFADPVVLLRAPFRITFAYAGPEGEWTNDWGGRQGACMCVSGELPRAVRFEVRDADRGLAVSTATRVHAEMRAPQPEQAKEARPEVIQAQPNNGAEVR